MSEPSDLSACDALELMRQRKLSAVELVRSCLARIEALEPTIIAWTFLDADGALRRAGRLDAKEPQGALHGLPIGVKDLIDTADMPTEYGCPEIFKGWRPIADAACVTVAKKADGIILGKTVTQAFGCGAVVKTANPLNPDHTAGGSSAGSAAAVAARMSPLALGSQSASSLIRPASYNGLIGMRPSMNLINGAGFKYFNGSFDTIGLVARTVDDVELMWTSQVGIRFERGTLPKRTPRFAICRPPWLDKAEPSAHAAIDAAERKLAGAGAEVRELVLPDSYRGLVEAHEKMQEFEAARSYAWEYENHRDALDPKVIAIIEAGLALPFEKYLEYTRLAQRARTEFPALLGNSDCILTAAAPGEAPKGWRALGERFTTMGDTTQSRAWTLLHLPVVSVPCHRGANGLPVGVQLIGPFGDDLHLLHVARWAESACRG
ncbi:MAG: amidase [Betaproteobacteria bacterium]|nr:MAG: amidase [Betaproteobacteria bacterium]